MTIQDQITDLSFKVYRTVKRDFPEWYSSIAMLVAERKNVDILNATLMIEREVGNKLKKKEDEGELNDVDVIGEYFLSGFQPINMVSVLGLE